jgi:hypothetical protein
VELTDIDKRFSLLLYEINYCRKNFKSAGPWGEIVAALKHLAVSGMKKEKQYFKIWTF